MTSNIRLPITEVYKEVQYIPAKKHPRFTTLITIHSGVSAYHLDCFLKYNDDTDVFVIYDIRPYIEEMRASHDYRWKNCDVPLREWWQKNSARVRSNKVLYMEYDVFVTTKITDDMFVEGVRTPSRFNIFTDIPPEQSWSNAPWWWSSDGDKLPLKLKQSAASANVTMLWFSSHALDCLALCDWDEVYSSDIIAEIRTPTILNYHNLALCNWDKSLGFVRSTEQHIKIEHEPDIVERIRNTEPGIYHPIKEPVDVFLAKQGDSLE